MHDYVAWLSATATATAPTVMRLRVFGPENASVDWKHLKAAPAGLLIAGDRTNAT
jgi:hypothetical protein